MPQSERSKNCIMLLAWIGAKSKSSNGASLVEIVRHVESEVTDLGATTRTAKSYLDLLVRHRFVSIHGTRFKITSLGKNWLDRKVS